MSEDTSNDTATDDPVPREHALTTEWRGHDIAVSGDWTLRWLYLTPTYTLWIDGKPIERVSGPSLEPTLEAVLEDDTGEAFQLKATLTSILGYQPPCKIEVEGELLAESDIHVANFLNPFLVLFILIATGTMAYVGPDVVSQYLP